MFTEFKYLSRHDDASSTCLRLSNRGKGPIVATFNVYRATHAYMAAIDFQQTANMTRSGDNLQLHTKQTITWMLLLSCR